MRIKVYGESTTRKSDLPPLCDSCRYGQRVRGVKRGDDFTECHALDKTIRIHVTECDAFSQKGARSAEAYEPIAWIRLDDNKWATPVERMTGKHLGEISHDILRRTHLL